MNEAMQRSLFLGGLAALIAAAGLFGVLGNRSGSRSSETKVLGIQVTPDAQASAPSFFAKPSPGTGATIPRPALLPFPVPTPKPAATTTTTTSTTTSTTSSAVVTSTTPKPAAKPPVQRPVPINCADPAQTQYCTASESMQIKDGKLSGRAVPSQAVSTTAPTFTEETTPKRSDGQTAGTGDAVSTVTYKLKVVNNTNKTFFMPGGDLELKLTKDGQAVDIPPQHQGDVTLAPGASIEATFDYPAFGDGTYVWHGETFFYES